MFPTDMAIKYGGKDERKETFLFSFFVVKIIDPFEIPQFDSLIRHPYRMNSVIRLHNGIIVQHTGPYMCVCV